GDRSRFSGYRSAMRGADAAPVTFGWQPGASTVRVGRRSVELQEALTRRDAPTALFVSNDIGAIAMLEACESRGFSVPDDVSIVGFDDIAMAALRRISLTTIAQPLDFQAETAVSILLERIAQPRRRPRRVSVPVELRVRGSSGPARRRR